jgi:hypothetical protein
LITSPSNLVRAALVAGLLLLGGRSRFQEPKFSPVSQEARFFVQGWEVGYVASPEGWAYTKPMTITELRDFCKSQVCYVWVHYLKAGSSTIAELDEPSDLARILEISDSKVRTNYNVYALDLRYGYRYFPQTP